MRGQGGTNWLGTGRTSSKASSKSADRNATRDRGKQPASLAPSDRQNARKLSSAVFECQLLHGVVVVATAPRLAPGWNGFLPGSKEIKYLAHTSSRTMNAVAVKLIRTLDSREYTCLSALIRQ